MAGIAVIKDSVKLYISEAELTAADKIGNLVSIGDIASTLEEIDTTTIDSLAREFVTGFEDNGSIAIVQNITEDEYAKVTALKGAELNWAISAFDLKKKQVIGLKGKGTVNNLALVGISVGGLLQVSYGLRVSGAIDTDFVDPTVNTGA